MRPVTCILSSGAWVVSAGAGTAPAGAGVAGPVECVEATGGGTGEGSGAKGGGAVLCWLTAGLRAVWSGDMKCITSGQPIITIVASTIAIAKRIRSIWY